MVKSPKLLGYTSYKERWHSKDTQKDRREKTEWAEKESDTKWKYRERKEKESDTK